MSKLKILSLYILFFICLELICRLAVHSYSNPGLQRGQNVEDYPSVLTPYPHKGLVFSLRKNLDINFRGKKFTTNSSGFRAKEFTDKNERFRIIGLGDSVMMGWGVSDSDTYLSRLESNLNKSGLNVETINLATMGYNTTQEYYALKEFGMKLKPDLVLLNYVGNDYEEISYVTKVEHPKWNSPIYLFNVIQFGFTLLTGNYDKDLRYELRPIIEPDDFEDTFYVSLKKIIFLCRAHNVPLIVLMDSRYIGLAGKNSEIIQFLSDFGVQTINLYEMLRDLDEAVPISDAISILDDHNKKYLIEVGPGKDNHPNELWHRDIAEILQENIVKIIVQD